VNGSPTRFRDLFRSLTRKASPLTSQSMNEQYQRRLDAMDAIIHSPMLDEWHSTVAITDSSLLRTLLPILRNLHVEVGEKIAFIEMILDAEHERAPTWSPTFALSSDGTLPSPAQPSSSA
jgi:hypothetical protein